MQSAVSHHINALKEDPGLTLFERSTGQVALPWREPVPRMSYGAPSELALI